MDRTAEFSSRGTEQRFQEVMTIRSVEVCVCVCRQWTVDVTQKIKGGSVYWYIRVFNGL